MAITKVTRNMLNTGIVDNSNATAITIDSSENVTFASNITMSNASSPTILMTDTTNTLSLKMFSGNTTANIGTTTNHALTFFTNDGERVLIDAAGDMTLKTAGKRYYVPRASDGAATGSLYSPTDSNIRLSGAGSSAGTLEFQPSSGSGVSMSINSSGVVSLTKTGSQFTPLSYDQLVIQNGDATGIRIIDSGDGGGNGGHCGVGNDNGNLQLSTAGVMLFDTGFEATDQVYNGRHERMRIQSGGGISFNGDTAAANALDDYEEGTWTPQLIGTSGSAGSYAQQTPNAHYTKVGRLVTIQCTFYVTNKGSYSGKTRMTGLPFASATSTTVLSLGSFPDTGYGTTSGNVLISAQVDGSNNYIAFFDGSRLDPRHDYADVGTGYYVNVAGSYMAAT